MEQALALAGEAARAGEVPVGALAVDGNTVVGRGFNRREGTGNPLAHAELIALRQAALVRGAWRLSGITLYVTLEPCTMCAGALVQSRIARVVFGASDPKAGAVGSLYNLLDDDRLNHRVAVTQGVLREPCGSILTEFFAARRSQRRERL